MTTVGSTINNNVSNHDGESNAQTIHQHSKSTSRVIDHASPGPSPGQGQHIWNSKIQS
jgi:hypothetical protein